MNFLKSNKSIAVQLVGVAAVVLLLVFGVTTYSPETQATKSRAATQTKEVPTRLPATPVTSPAPIFQLPPPPPEIIQTVTAGPGDTFMKLLVKAGADRSSAHSAIRAMRKTYHPRYLKRGQKISVTLKPISWGVKTGEFIGYHFDSTVEETISVSRQENSRFTVKKIKKILDRKDVRISGSIRSSLYVAATKVGMPASTLVELIRLLSWDVDFQRDIQKNDKFDVMVERLHQKNGDFARWGKILYAELFLSGKPIRLYRYESKRHGVEYFDERGRSAQKALMKTPINGARLSSRYGRRRHPILGYTRMHRGVDFAAPRGTPIYAAGNGTVSYAGRKGGYGKYIRIRHNGRYSTAYAHLKSFKRGIRRGRRVTQGQVIGYVGSTGRSTGPHLHYEVHVNGRQANPLRLKLPSGRKLKGKELRHFAKIRGSLDRRLARSNDSSTTHVTSR
ncbi:MAG: peptidoglycan DD-metalloendopeptidase family protein [Alphaproteobacteria bacterium]|nr:peptidoglycan DD-metalloendopeptidase family protein [Alphaproteobacteria bacterium]